MQPSAWALAVARHCVYDVIEVARIRSQTWTRVELWMSGFAKRLCAPDCGHRRLRMPRRTSRRANCPAASASGSRHRRSTATSTRAIRRNAPSRCTAGNATIAPRNVQSENRPGAIQSGSAGSPSRRYLRRSLHIRHAAFFSRFTSGGTASSASAASAASSGITCCFSCRAGGSTPCARRPPCGRRRAAPAPWRASARAPCS